MNRPYNNYKKDPLINYNKKEHLIIIKKTI